MDWVDELVEVATKWIGEGWIREKIAIFAIQAFKRVFHNRCLIVTSIF